MFLVLAGLCQLINCEHQKYFRNTINSLLSPPGGLFSSSPFERGLNRDGGVFNLEKMMVSVVHKELEYKVEKLKYKKVGGHAAKDQNQIQTSSR